MADGKFKDLALQKAQIDFLKRAPNHAQLPVSWAGLVLVGSSEPILPQHLSHQKLLLWLGVAVIILVGFFGRRISRFFKTTRRSIS
jgi:hypothetical protein